MFMKLFLFSKFNILCFSEQKKGETNGVLIVFLLLHVFCSEYSFKKQKPKENDWMFEEETSEMINKMIPSPPNTSSNT